MTPRDQANMAKMMWLIVVCIIIGAAIADRVKAQPVALENFTPEAHLWLARGVVGEASYLNHFDHIAIANVLARRHKLRLKQIPDAPFVGMVREYMAGMGKHLKKPSKRQFYIRRLPYKMPATDVELSTIQRSDGWDAVATLVPEPEGWPAYALDWENQMVIWNLVLERMSSWALGKYEDLCPAAIHWGSPVGIDRIRAVRAGWQVEDCGDTVNIFYSTASSRAAVRNE